MKITSLVFVVIVLIVLISVAYVFSPQGTKSSAEITGRVAGVDPSGGAGGVVPFSPVQKIAVLSWLPDEASISSDIGAARRFDGRGEGRSFVKFDLSRIPKDAKITSVVFSLNYDNDYNSPSSGLTLRVSQANAQWSESTNWKNQPSFSDNYYADAIVTARGETISLSSDSLNDLVKGWMSGAIQNNGLAIRLLNPNSNGDIWDISGNVKLTVSYTISRV